MHRVGYCIHASGYQHESDHVPAATSSDLLPGEVVQPPEYHGPALPSTLLLNKRNGVDPLLLPRSRYLPLANAYKHAPPADASLPTMALPAFHRNARSNLDACTGECNLTLHRKHQVASDLPLRSQFAQVESHSNH